MTAHTPESDQRKSPARGAFAVNDGLFIVGGGPAGLATAILARQKGFLHVTVADHARPLIDKACGEGLLPDTVAAIGLLGVRFQPDEAIPFRGIRFVDVGNKVSVEASFPGGAGLGVRRTVLHAKLLQRATKLGVFFAWGARVTQLDEIESRWVIGADGQDSQIRKLIFPRSPRLEQIRFGFRQHFELVPWTDFVEVYWGDGCQITVTPVGAREICVAATSRDARMKLQGALARIPPLAERIAGARATTQERGSVTALRRLWNLHTGRFALVGDASGSVDPVTGEGLGLAFRQADALTDALRDNRLPPYQSEHARISRVPRRMSRLMLTMDAKPWFRKRVMLALANDPHLFSLLLNVHIQAINPLVFGAANALRLGWRLLATPS